jgi:hypothetical protein
VTLERKEEDMARTMTHDQPLYRYPVGWVAAVAVAALLGVAASALPGKAPSPSTPGENYMIEQNFAP